MHRNIKRDRNAHDPTHMLNVRTVLHLRVVFVLVPLPVATCMIHGGEVGSGGRTAHPHLHKIIWLKKVQRVGFLLLNAAELHYIEAYIYGSFVIP